MSARERLRQELVWHRRFGLRTLAAVPVAAAVSVAETETETEAASTAVAVSGTEAVTEVEAGERAGVGKSGSGAVNAASLAELAEMISTCEKCRLCEQRTHAVPGEGAERPPILFIGEGPGRDEDRSGRPFVGKAGQLLDKMIAALNYRREEVYIANVVKCRPPGNRTPMPDEVAACFPYLQRQIELIQPRVICTLGSPSTKAMVPTVRSISAARGKRFQYQGIDLVPTFHPAYLLRNPSAKRPAWEDLQLVQRIVAEPQGDEGPGAS